MGNETKTEEKPTGEEKAPDDAAAAGKGVAKKEEAPPPVPVEYEAYAEDAGMGYDNQTSEDISIPFIDILQPGSPEVKGENPTGKGGQIVNRSSGALYDAKDGANDGALFVPCYTEHVMVEWVPIDKGGGLVATHQMTDQLVQNVRNTQPLGKYKHPENGNDLVETFYVYGIFIPPGDAAPHPAVMAMSSTKIKRYKDWMFQARSVIIQLPDGRKLTKVPLWAHRYRFTTQYVEKNSFSWYNWVIRFDGGTATEARLPANSELYAMGKQLYEEASKGLRSLDTEALRREEVDGAPAKGDTNAGEAPY